MKTKVFSIFALSVLMITLIAPIPVLAIADPDSPPQVSAVYVYEDLLETGDVGILIDYYLEYAALPSETATEAYLAVFVDTDGTTQLKSVAPYTFVNSGYRRGLAWIYFSAEEVTAYSIDQANEADYDIWLMGNPTLSWAGDPPKTIVGVDYWQTTGDTAVLLALRVLYYADVLELIWTLDMIETTALGNRLTAVGESYFENVITNLRIMAPLAFSVSEVSPTIEELDYNTSFGATMTDGTGTVTGSPITLTEGNNTVTVTATGTFVLALNQGTVGTVTDGTGTVTGSPVDIVAGENTITVTGIGTLVVAVALQDTTSAQEDIIIGTGFDLTDVADDFGMSRWFFSGLVWMIMSVLICAAVFRNTPEGYGGASKIVLVVFDVCIISGVLLGLLKPVVAVGLFLAFGVFTGYILFYRGSNF